MIRKLFCVCSEHNFHHFLSPFLAFGVSLELIFNFNLKFLCFSFHFRLIFQRHHTRETKKNNFTVVYSKSSKRNIVKKFIKNIIIKKKFCLLFYSKNFSLSLNCFHFFLFHIIREFYENLSVRFQVHNQTELEHKIHHASKTKIICKEILENCFFFFFTSCFPWKIVNGDERFQSVVYFVRLR